MIHTGYLRALRLLELWALFYFILCVLICICTRPIFLLLLLSASGLLRLGLCVLLAGIICPLSSDEIRQERCLSILEVGLAGVIDVVVSDRSDSVRKCLLALNYPSNFSEYLLVPMYLRSRKINFSILTGQVAGRWARMFMGEDAVIALDADRGNYEAVRDAVFAKLNQGYTVIVYPERNFSLRTSEDRVVELRSGVFAIVKELSARLVLGVVGSVQHVVGFVRNPRVNVVFEEAHSPDPASAGKQMQDMLDRYK